MYLASVISDFSSLLRSAIEIVFEWPFTLLNQIRFDSSRIQLGYVFLALTIFSVLFVLFIRNR